MGAAHEGSEVVLVADRADACGQSGQGGRGGLVGLLLPKLEFLTEKKVGFHVFEGCVFIRLQVLKAGRVLVFLEDQIREVVTQVHRTDADGSARYDIGDPVSVVEDTRYAGDCGSGVCSDAVPGALRSIFFVQECGGQEGGGRMSAGERVVAASIRPETSDRIFDAVDGQGHDARRAGISNQHGAPSGFAFHAERLESQHQGCGSVLQVVIVFVVEVRDCIVAQVLDVVVQASYSNSC